MQATTPELYNLLLAGKKLQLHFRSVQDAAIFRIRLAQYKSRQEKEMLGLGMMEETERSMTVFRYDADTGIATIIFQQRPDPRQFSFKILDE